MRALGERPGDTVPGNGGEAERAGMLEPGKPTGLGVLAESPRPLAAPTPWLLSPCTPALGAAGATVLEGSP